MVNEQNVNNTMNENVRLNAPVSAVAAAPIVVDIENVDDTGVSGDNNDVDDDNDDDDNDDDNDDVDDDENDEMSQDENNAENDDVQCDNETMNERNERNIDDNEDDNAGDESDQNIEEKKRQAARDEKEIRALKHKLQYDKLPAKVKRALDKMSLAGLRLFDTNKTFRKYVENVHNKHLQGKNYEVDIATLVKLRENKLLIPSSEKGYYQQISRNTLIEMYLRAAVEMKADKSKAQCNEMWAIRFCKRFDILH